MRRLVYALTFAFVLVLAGSAVLAEPAVPDGGGTVPDGDYQVWLPVVGGYGGDPYCQVIVEFETPADGAVITGNTVDFFGR